jgi:hypothetical protein
MSDFLHRLISRTMGTAPILERRRSSIFEPTLNRTAQWLADETGQQESESAGHAPRQSLESALTPPKPANNFSGEIIDQTSASIRAKDRAVELGEKGQRVMHSVVSSDAQPAAVKPAASERLVERVVERIQQSTTSRSDRTEYHEVREVVHDRATAPVSELREVHFIEQPTAHDPSAGKDKIKPTLTVSPLLPPKTVQVSRNVPVLPPQMPRRQKREAFISEARKETPAPIHVTIGKIEVRASKPVAPLPTRQKAAPALGLDEYLRGRSRGNR